MRKLKNGLLLLIVLLIGYVLLASYLFMKTPYHCQNCEDVVQVHFIHGSFPKEECTDQRKRVGGLLGGHVEIEIDQHVFGFEFKDAEDIHLFPKSNPAEYNSTFTKKKKSDWQKETKNDKMTSIYIPVDEKQKSELLTNLLNQYAQLPYDYAFLGMRCTSSVYEHLATVRIFPQKSRWQYILLAFYPRQLRNKMWRWADRNHLKVVLKKGIDCRVWE